MIIDFTKIAGLVPEHGSLTIVLQNIADGKLVVSITPKYKKQDKNGEVKDAAVSGEGFSPMVVSGTPEELMASEIQDVGDIVALQKVYLALPDVQAVSPKKKDVLKKQIQAKKDKNAKTAADNAKATEAKAEEGKAGAKPAEEAKTPGTSSLSLFDNAKDEAAVAGSNTEEAA